MPSPLDTRGCRARGAMVARATVSAAGTGHYLNSMVQRLAGELVSHAKGGESHLASDQARCLHSCSTGRNPNTEPPSSPWQHQARCGSRPRSCSSRKPDLPTCACQGASGVHQRFTPLSHDQQAASKHHPQLNHSWQHRRHQAAQACDSDIF